MQRYGSGEATQNVYTRYHQGSFSNRPARTPDWQAVMERAGIQTSQQQAVASSLTGLLSSDLEQEMVTPASEMLTTLYTAIEDNAATM